MAGHRFRTLRRASPVIFVHLAVAPGDATDDGRQAGQMRDVARELALTMDGDRLPLVAGAIYDLDLARLHNEEVHVPFAHRKERLPVPEQLRLGMGAARQLTDLCLIQCGERD